MRIDYDTLASTYDTHRRGGGPYMERLVTLALDCNAQRVLELGAGTGNNTEALLHRHPCRMLWALERSHGMIDKGKRKALPVHWIQGDAESLPFATDCADFLYSVYMLHHIRRLDRLLAECARVLGNGCAAFVTTTHDFIRRHPMNAYFPRFASVDTSRFQDVPEVVAAMQAAGFLHVQSVICRAEPVPIDMEYVDKVAGQFLSTFALLPREEFESGLACLRADVAKYGKLRNPIAWESAIIWATK
jgi:ubiquinone/menaquinone biosynthesis C-methylase UbiE